MTDDDRDDGQAANWTNEYAAWCDEQDEREADEINRLLSEAAND